MKIKMQLVQSAKVKIYEAKCFQILACEHNEL